MSDKPKRIQRKRTKGWRMPPNTVCVTRPGRFGNPFSWRYWVDAAGFSESLAKEWTVKQFRDCIIGSDSPLDPDKEEAIAIIKRDIGELRGKNLACFCKEGAMCHVPCGRVAGAAQPREERGMSEELEDVREMCDIIGDDASTDQERHMALLTLIELVDPSILDTEEFRRESKEWDRLQGIEASPVPQEATPDGEIVIDGETCHFIHGAESRLPGWTIWTRKQWSGGKCLRLEGTWGGPRVDNVAEFPSESAAREFARGVGDGGV